MSKETISTVTDTIIDEMTQWQNRLLDAVCPVVSIDAIRGKVRDGSVSDKAFHAAVAVTVDGERDVLGIWAGQEGGGEGAKYRWRVLTEIRNRGAHDLSITVRDGVKGLPEAITAVWGQAVVRTCVDPPAARHVPACRPAGPGPDQRDDPPGSAAYAVTRQSPHSMA